MLKKLSIILLFMSLSINYFCENNGSIREELAILKPLINNTWVCDDKHPRTKQLLHHSFKLIAIQDGMVLKIHRNCEELGVSADGFYYYDPVEGKIAFLILSSNGNYSSGHIKREDGKILMFGYSVFPDRKLQFRNTLEINEENQLIDKYFWFDGENWNPGHARVYSKSDN